MYMCCITGLERKKINSWENTAACKIIGSGSTASDGLLCHVTTGKPLKTRETTVNYFASSSM